MDTIRIILYILFFAVSILMTIAVLMQSNRGGGLSGMLGGGSSSQNPFGSSAGDVMARVTRWMGIAFFAICLGFAILFNKAPASADAAEEAVKEIETQQQQQTGSMTGDSAEDTDKKGEMKPADGSAPAGGAAAETPDEPQN